MIRNRLVSVFLAMIIIVVIGFDLPVTYSHQAIHSPENNSPGYWIINNDNQESNSSLFDTHSEIKSSRETLEYQLIDTGGEPEKQRENYLTKQFSFFFPFIKIFDVGCIGQVDEDGDGFTSCEGDCYDSNPHAFPGSAYWSATDRGDGSFDFNCDETSTLRWTELVRCEEFCDNQYPWMCYCWPLTPGWFSKIPGCGLSDYWTDTCTVVRLPACGPAWPWYVIQECQ